MSDPARSSSQYQRTEAGSPDSLDRTVPHGYEAPDSQAGDPKFAPARDSGDLGRLGRFRVVQKLGRGGMGAVYLGYDETLERTVALKVLLPAQAAFPDARERFLREARAAARIKSDHVVTIYEVGDEDGNPFIAMEHLLGTSLERYRSKQGELPLAQAIRVGRETALGLAAAHELNVVHRDIKPGNLWLESPNGRVKILDFGLARVATESVQLTHSGAVVGTPAYMSPEQGRGHAVDHRGDLFSLGAVLFRLVTGQMPFKGDTTMAILSSLALDVPPPVRQLNPEAPKALEAIITRLLQKDPEARFPSALEVAEALHAVEQPASGLAVVPIPMRVEPQSGAPNVWEGIEATEGDLAPATEVHPAPGKTPAPPPAPVVRRPKPKPRARWLPVALAGAALLVAGVLLAAILDRVSKGTLVVESDDEGAELVIKKDGDVVRDRTKDREIRLRAGTYTVELADPRPGLKVTPDRIEIAGGKASRVRVAAVPPPKPPTPRPPPPTASPERKAAEYILSLGGAVTIAESAAAIRRAADLPKDRFTLTGCSAGSLAVTDAGLESFKDCPDLTGLDLSSTQVTDAGLGHFKNCKKLTHLNLAGVQLTDAGLAHFKGCPDLTSLNLTFTKTGDAGLENFKDCAKLAHVSLPRTKVTDVGMGYLKGCTSLHELSVADAPITDAGLAHLKGRVSLQQLFLDNTPITDKGLEHLKDCKFLVDLNLTGTQITDAGLAHLKDCKRLRMLSVWNTGVGDAGLSHFKDCPRLKELDVRRTKVTARMLAELAESLPGCSITHNGGTIEPKK